MSLDSTIARLREKEEASWRSEGTLRARSDVSAFDAATGDVIPDPASVVYEGPLQVRPAGRRIGSDVLAGDQELRVTTWRAKFPTDTPVEIDHELELTVSDYDADLVGRVFRVTDVLRDDWQIARIAMLEEVG